MGQVLMNTVLLEIERLASDSQGVATIDGKRMLVPLALPGDVARVQLVRDHGQYWEGRLIEIVTPSPDRITPKCPIFGDCGGCQLQHLQYSAQLHWKKLWVEDALARIARIRKPTVLSTIPSAHPWNYRTRITLHCDRQGRIGFYKEGTHEAIPFEECPIASAKINERLADEKQKISGKPGHYEVRTDDGEGFTQIHPGQNAVLQRLVVEGLKGRPAAVVAELFCGNGNFSFPLAPHVGKLYGCDTHTGSIDAAIAYAKSAGVKNVQFVAMGSYRFLRDLQAQGVKPDGILLDPPRRGAIEIIPGILEISPRWIAYISCNPATLARDLKDLCHGGYKLEACQPVDMFPQTIHVEMISWFSR